MEIVNPSIIWFMALWFGALHAFDADHVLTLVNVAPTRTNRIERLIYCLRWAIGHGVAILVLGGSVIYFKTAIPVDIPTMAEHLVGVVLLLVGAIAFYHATRSVWLARQIHSESHQPYVNQIRPTQSGYRGQSLGIGFLHGTAGSATILALLPIIQMPTWQGLSYLLLFSMGVLASMLLFGSVFGSVLQYVRRRSLLTLSTLRMAMALPAMGIGLWMALPI